MESCYKDECHFQKQPHRKQHVSPKVTWLTISITKPRINSIFWIISEAILFNSQEQGQFDVILQTEKV